MHDLTGLICARSQFIEDDKIVYIKIVDLEDAVTEWMKEHPNASRTDKLQNRK